MAALPLSSSFSSFHGCLCSSPNCSGHDGIIVFKNCIYGTITPLHAQESSQENNRPAFSTLDQRRKKSIRLENVEDSKVYQMIETQGQRPSQQQQQQDRNGIASLLQGRIALSQGKRLHERIIRRGLDRDTFLGNLLITMYAKQGALQDARNVFDRMHQRDVVSWNVMISVYVQHGNAQVALQHLERMQQEGLTPNKVTLVTALSACASLASLKGGETIHACVIGAGFEADMVVGTALVNMYGKCGALDDALLNFSKLQKTSVISWNCMIAIYEQNGYNEVALQLYHRMQEVVKPDRVTFLSIVGVCGNLKSLIEGQLVHSCIANSGCEPDVFMGSALVDMYGKCGALSDARCVFDSMHQRDVILWTAIITAYAQQGHGKEALQLFRQMLQEGWKPNDVTHMSVVSACAGLLDLAQGRAIHGFLVDSSFEINEAVMNALVNMYGKCGALEDAQSVFDKMHQRDMITWTALIDAYTQQGQGEEGINLFWQMLKEGVKPDEGTFVTALSACASVAALATGKLMHQCIVDSGFGSSMVLGNALLNMYGKCGALWEARTLFDQLYKCNAISWTSMIAAYAQQGFAKEALKLFQEMLQDSVKPNEAIFVSLLSACSHAGLIEEGLCSFKSIRKDHGIVPVVEHYGCLVDLLGRAGLLEEAEDLIHGMPLPTNTLVWMVLLGACRLHGDVKRGKRAAEHIIAFNSQNPPYVIYQKSLLCKPLL